MDTIKSISEMELTVIKDALKKVENDIRLTAANIGTTTGAMTMGQSWSGGKWSKSAMEHKAIMNLKELGNDKAGFRQWHDKFVNALAQVNREYRVALQEIVNGIEKEKLPVGGVAHWDTRINSKQTNSWTKQQERHTCA